MEKMIDPKQILKLPYARVVVPEADGTFRAEILEFPGCIASGDSAAEALAMLEEIAESWLESTIANGQQVPEPTETIDFSGKLVLRLPKSLHRDATFAAKREGVSLNQFIVTGLATHLGSFSHSNRVTTQAMGLSVINVLPQHNSGVVFLDFSAASNPTTAVFVQAGGTPISWPSLATGIQASQRRVTHG